MATGSVKITVMGMLAAWSILNKVADRSNAKFSDIVLIICPNITIKSRLQELNPDNGEASLYRTRDLVPSHLMDKLRRGKVLVTNWHIFEKRAPATWWLIPINGNRQPPILLTIIPPLQPLLKMNA
jgi:type III restriction enzyme